MGAVLLGYDITLAIKVAVKENLNLNPESERQFHREARMLAALRHPNLPRVTDHLTIDDRQYLVMDYIEGTDLQEHLAKKRPSDDHEDKEPIPKRLACVQQAAPNQMIMLPNHRLSPNHEYEI